MKLGWIFLLSALTVAYAMPERMQSVKIGDVTALLEIADDDAEVVQGLSDRTELPPDQGMLFVFPKPAARSFWMYHCYIDIDLAYVKPDGTISEIITMKAEPITTPPALLKVYHSHSDSVQYVIEMSAGWFAENGIVAGQHAAVSKFRSKMKKDIE